MLLVWTVQPPQVSLAVERRADLQRRRGGCRRHATEGQSSLVGDAGPRHCPSGGQGVELGVDLGVRRRRGQVGAEAWARGVGRV